MPAWVVDFAHRCVDAETRAFVGHGAPVLQAIEIYKGAPLFYGLGNFLFPLKEGQAEWSPSEVIGKAWSQPAISTMTAGWRPSISSPQFSAGSRGSARTTITTECCRSRRREMLRNRF